MEKAAELLQKRSKLSEAKKALLQKRLLGSTEHEIKATTIPPRAPHSNTILSFAQQRLWFLDQLAPGSSFYTIPLLVHLNGPLNIPLLHRCLYELVQRHETLRTNFVMQGELPTQLIAPSRPFTMPLLALDTLAEPVRSATIELLSHQEALLPFHLTHEPLIRCTLFRLSPQHHLLQLTLHHIIADGWSLDVLNRELATLYYAFLHGHPSPLPPLPIQYADFALWQHAWLEGPILQQQLTYWRKQLADLTPLEFPLDHPRLPIQSFHGALLPFHLSEPLSHALLDHCKREGVTLFMALLSAFQMLLSRYCGQADIAVGTPISGRTSIELEGLVGFFVNTLVIRTNLSDNPSSQTMLTRVKEIVLEAFSNQDVPFEKLVEDLQPERNLSRTPLIQTLFTLKVPSVSSQKVADLTLQAAELASETTQFDLMLTMAEEQQQIIGHFQYNTDLFDTTTLQRLSAHFVVLLEALVHTPHLPLWDIPLLSQTELHKVLVEWNGTRSSYPVHECLPTLVEMQSASAAESIAVVIQDYQFTYGELNRRAHLLACHLRARGVRSETLIGICLDRSFELIVSILAILKAGGAYVPLDPHYPPERLAFLTTDAGISCVLTLHALRERLSSSQAAMICLDTDWPSIAAGNASTTLPPVDPEALAYVIYTSGSTGTPKGVMVTHANVIRLFRATHSWFAFHAQDVWTLFHSYAFDFSVWELWGALLHGGRLVIVPYLVSRSPSAFYELLHEQSITILNQTPSAFLQLIPEAHGRELPLRCIIFGGEALDPQRLQTWAMRHDAMPLPFVNMYGITETTVHVTYHPLTHEDIHGPTPGRIGKAIPDLQLYLLDTHLHPVPIGVVGEMYVGGSGLSRGYLHQPDLTGERFIPHPFSHEPGARLYKTGDLARYLPDGNLEYKGRSDEQVKIRGFRIELGEIEAILIRHADVHEALVIVRHEHAGDKRLVAYVVPEPGASPSKVALRQYVHSQLPEHMIPSFFVIVDAMPLTTHGKIDRKALPVPDENKEEQPDVLPAQTPLQTLIAGIWCDLLGPSQIGLHDNFFESGGHSLLATQMISRVRSVLGIELALKNFFEAPTIAGIATQIEQGLRTQQVVKTPIVPVPRTQPLPLSFAQQRLWFLDQLESRNTTYLMPLAVRLQGNLNVRVLQHSLQEIVQRHECLRTTFTTYAGQPVQIIHDNIDIPIAHIDLQGLPGPQQASLVAHVVEEGTQYPFHLNRGPLLRGSLLRIDEEEHIFMIVMHHIISDAWSLGIIVHEFAVLYTAFTQDKPSPLAPLPIQYADFAAWQQSWLRGEVLDALASYWKKQLSEATPLALPTDRPPDQIKSARGAQHPFTLPATLSQALITLSNQEKVTLFMTLLAAFQTLLYRYSDQTDSVIGTDIANRTHEESEKLIGFFVNLLVLRTDLSGKPSFRALLQRVRRVILDAYAYQDLPFEKLIDELRLERTTRQTPLVRALFVLQNTPMPPLELPGIVISPLNIELNTAKFDLVTFMWEEKGTLVGMLNYRTDAFDAHTIETLAIRFEALLHAIIAQPDKSIDLLNLSSASELQEEANKETSDHEMNRRKLKIARRKDIALIRPPL